MNLTSSRRKIFAINGSASAGSANQKLIEAFTELTRDYFDVTIYNELKTLPHFDPELSTDNTPPAITALRSYIDTADGVLICTPEYVFSIPSGLKNAIEWCVSTVVFSDKPVGIITASASGQKGHEELQMIMKTVMAKLTPDTNILIQGIKGKVNEQGKITDGMTRKGLEKFSEAFRRLVEA